MAHPVPARLSPAEGRRFGVQVGLAFGVLGGIAWWRQHPTAAAVLLALGAALLLGGLLLPAQMGPVYRGWMRMALAISRVTTPIIMGIIFFLVVTPSGLLLRLFRHRPLVRSRSEGSYWVDRRAPGQAHGDMHRQF